MSHMHGKFKHVMYHLLNIQNFYNFQISNIFLYKILHYPILDKISYWNNINYYRLKTLDYDVRNSLVHSYTKHLKKNYQLQKKACTCREVSRYWNLQVEL